MTSSTFSATNNSQPSQSQGQRLSGSCLCGASRYTVLNQPIKSVICHCINCKKWSGGAFASNILFPLSTFELKLRDEKSSQVQVRMYPDSNTDSGNTINRHFCTGCGCSMFMTVPHLPEVVSITSGTVDGVVDGGAEEATQLTEQERLKGLRPELEFYCQRMAPWVEITVETEKLEAQD